MSNFKKDDRIVAVRSHSKGLYNMGDRATVTHYADFPDAPVMVIWIDGEDTVTTVTELNDFITVSSLTD